MAKVCSIEGCQGVHVARGWCSSHYQRWRAHGDPFGGRIRQTCSVDGCDALAHGHGWCHRHYMFWRRHGDPVWTPTTYEVCTVEGCDKSPRSPTADLCDMHYCRRWRTGSVDGVPTRRAQTPGYRSAHWRVGKDRGKAKTHRCVDCSEAAAHWSFAWRRVPIEQWLWGEVGGGICVYSGDTADYDPRCLKCATDYDRAFATEGWKQLAALRRETATEQPGGFNA